MRKSILAVLFIIASIIAVYINSIDAPFILDDTAKITENPDIKSLKGLGKKLIYPYDKDNVNFFRNDPSRPVVYFTYALNYHFNGLKPSGYRIFNIFLHILNSILIFILVRKIWSYLFTGNGFFTAVFIALLFAVHPVNTGTVTYISGRSVLLGTVFYLSALLLFLHSVKKRPILYLLSLLCFISALFSRQDAVILVFILLLIDLAIVSGFNSESFFNRKNKHFSYWTVLVLYLLFRLYYFKSIGDIEADELIPAFNYITAQPLVILRYLRLLLIPAGLSMDHIISKVGTLYDHRFIVPLIVILTAVYAAVKSTLRRRSPSSVLLMVSFLWFLFNIAPTSSFFPTTAYMAENRLYLPSLGIYMIIGFLIYRIFSINSGRNRNIQRLILQCLVCVYLICMGVMSFSRNRLYNNRLLLWKDVIAQYPNSPRAHFALGNIFSEEGDHEQAEKEYLDTIKFKPDYEEAYHNLGILYDEIGRYEESIALFLKALSIDPGFADAYACLGNVYYKQREYEKSIKYFKKAISIKSDSLFYHNNLGLAYAKTGNDIMALREYQYALKVDPSDADAYFNIGRLYARKKDFIQALDAYRKSEKLDPDQPSTYTAMAAAYEAVEEYDLAIMEYKKAVALNPNYIKAHIQLGDLYILKKKIFEAIKEYEIVLKLDPDNNDIKEKINKLKDIQLTE
ncbi:tetratricopeptide repeat protein [Elusimicrobiota bacterium]